MTENVSGADVSGFIVLDKAGGVSSFKALSDVRRLISEGKIKSGHTGTLDPMATGVLCLAFGRATSFIPFVGIDAKKKYRAGMRLGVETDTYDITGDVVSENDNIPPFEETVSVINSFLGESEQTPPMYSAVKVGGRKLYDLARRGIEVERKKRKINIFSISDIEKDETGDICFTVECSKGVYIRSLVYDIGRKSGCGASLVSLRRLSSDGFDISQAHTLDELKSGNISDYLITVEEEFSYLNNIFLSEKQSVRFLNGGNISRISSNENGLYRVYSPEKKFLGLGTFGSDGLKPEKLFF